MSLLLHLLLAPALASPPPATPQPAPVKVMIVGTFHMANPGHDIHNFKVDDMLAPKRQAEIAALTSGLARFQPTRVVTEEDMGVSEQYPKYLAGTLPPSRNEIVQVAFRLASLMGLKSVQGIDVSVDFPYPPVEAYAKAHGQSALLDRLSAGTEADLQAMGKALAEKGVGGALRYLNDPAQVRASQDWYRSILRIGAGNEQPAVDLLTNWYRRNFLICANPIQVSQPGDRIAVLYGAGHAHLLRQWASETPGFELVEANDYLPR
jgi:hypothetical protein